METDKYIIIGKIGAPYGVKGWLRITSFTARVTDILGYTPWFLENKESWKKIDTFEGRPHGKGIVVKFPEQATPEGARALTGQKIYGLCSQLPKLKKNEYYWRDLEGLTVINQDGALLGKIVYLIETGANDVMVVKGNKEQAIPYLPGEVITSIDLVSHIMHVNWDVL